mmetsp:Transcript_37493/g.45659  ORF Transcript_37493/g.45659 Transcript_37493/m.45659 type:complete len:108 (+) Transcript_37493:3-326(+)
MLFNQDSVAMLNSVGSQQPLLQDSLSLQQQSQHGANPAAQNSKQLQLKEDLHMVIPGLYLGNFNAVLNTERLRRLGISHILILAYPTPSHFEDDFRYMCIELIDDHK